MTRVFISHATADRSRVTRDIIDLLKDHGIDVWFAEDDIATARRWERSILEGLETCDWFIVVLTPRSAQSEWVKDEVHWAVSERPERIVPVLMEDCDVRDIHIRLPRIQHVDFRDVNDDSRRRLLRCWDVDYRQSARFDVRFNSLGNRYKIDRPTAHSDFLREFLGTDTVLNRPVLIKCDDGRYYTRRRSPVTTEVFATASFVNASTPRVFDLANDQEIGTYSVLEHIPGHSLSDRIRDADGLLEPPAVVAILISLCGAVHYANDKGVIHRNIKPGSIVLDQNDQPYLTNFIVAKLADDSAEPGEIAGTVNYMAPEQCRGDSDIDCRVDVWGLGVLLYELLTGRLPFHRDSLRGDGVDIFESIMHDVPSRLRDHNKNTPKTLERICLKCLEKDRGDRYSTALELAHALTANARNPVWAW